MKKQFIAMLALAFCLSTPALAGHHMNKEKPQKGNQKLQQKDYDGDGYISKSEMLRVHEERIDRMFETHDSDGDGLLSKEELQGMRQQKQNKATERKNMKEMKNKKEMKGKGGKWRDHDDMGDDMMDDMEEMHDDMTGESEE